MKAVSYCGIWNPTGLAGNPTGTGEEGQNVSTLQPPQTHHTDPVKSSSGRRELWSLTTLTVFQPSRFCPMHTKKKKKKNAVILFFWSTLRQLRGVLNTSRKLALYVLENRPLCETRVVCGCAGMLGWIVLWRMLDCGQSPDCYLCWAVFVWTVDEAVTASMSVTSCIMFRLGLIWRSLDRAFVWYLL